MTVPASDPQRFSAAGSRFVSVHVQHNTAEEPHCTAARQSVKDEGTACRAEMYQDEKINELENHLTEEESAVKNR